MSIFEKIKQFLKNITNRQKLLESPKEIREETSDMTSTNKKQSQFLEDIKFDPKDLLDPRICQGDNLVPNILRTLGANEEIINNPQAIEAIRLQIRGIADQKGLKMPNKDTQPTRKEIQDIVEAVKSSMVLSGEQRKGKYDRMNAIDSQQIYYGLTIDKETGNVTIGTLNIAGKLTNPSFSSNKYKESTFSLDRNGNVVETASCSKITDDHKAEMLEYDSRTVLNSDGIAMESEVRSYEQIDGEDRINYHRISKRDSEYPFIAQEEVLVNNRTSDKYAGTRYKAIAMKDLSQLGNPEYQKDEEGRITITPITFDNREEISEYYQENKEIIDDALMQEPNHGLFPSKGLKQSLKAGIRKLAVKAGILPNEHEQQTEIGE